jgi:hypothetical protein
MRTLLGQINESSPTRRGCEHRLKAPSRRGHYKRMLSPRAWRQFPGQVRMHGLHPRSHLARETLEPRAADPGLRGGPPGGSPPPPELLNGPGAFRSCPALTSPCN